MKKQLVNKCYRAVTLVLCLFGSCFVVQASEIGSSADISESKSWGISVFGTESKIEPKVKASGTDLISVPTTGGSASLFSSSDAEIKMEQQSSALVAKVEFRPGDALKYRFKVGQIREFDLEFSSGSQTNKLQSTKDGLLWGFGVSGSFAPGSIVSTAVGWDLSYTRTDVDLDRFEGGPVVYASNESFRQEEYQGSISCSRRWKMIDPYIGLKVMYVISRLQDDETKERVSGKTSFVSPFAGVQWLFADRESFVVEGSLVGEKSLTAGFKMQF